MRQAVALLINRDRRQGPARGQAHYGNDSPFAPVYKSTDTSVPQRKQDIEQAKALLAEAGKETFRSSCDVAGVRGPRVRGADPERPQGGGHHVKLNITDAASYYGDAVYGKSPWLDSTFGITEYGHRGAPNVYLDAPLKSDGTWNGATSRTRSTTRS